MAQSDCTEHAKLPGHEIWLPTKCRTNTYTCGDFPGEIFNTPFWTEMMEVSEFGTNPVPDELFTLKYTIPGTEVFDKTLPEAKQDQRGVYYRIPANPEDLARVIADARSSIRDWAEREKRQNTQRTVFLVGNAVILVVLLVYLVVQHRRKAAKS